jgi:hypothetical protein
MNNDSLNNIAYELFGEMRYLTPEENEKKQNMYRGMSTVISDIKLFDEELIKDGKVY